MNEPLAALAAPAVSAPTTASTEEDRAWSLVSYLGPLFVSAVAPLVVLLMRGPKAPFARAHAVESLNLQITVMIATVVSFPLCLVYIGFPLLFGAWIAWIVVSVRGAMKASRGQLYRSRLVARFVK